MSRPSGANRWTAAGATALLLALGAPGTASADEPGAAQPLASEQQQVSGGSGNQTDPHLSGSLLVFTAQEGTTSVIRYVDLADGSGADIDTAGHRDMLPDVSGDLIAFRRVHTDGSGHRIMIFDVGAAEAGAREVAPLEGARRSSPSIGGTTVGFEQLLGASSSQSDICVADVSDPGAAAVCITTDGATVMNHYPAVGPDGSTVAFEKCAGFGTGCDIYVARKGTDGTWGTAEQLTDAPGEEIQPDTDGTIVTYASDAAGDFDIWWQNVDGTGADRLVLPDAPGSIEYNPNLSGGVISFEREVSGSPAGDLYAYRLGSGDLFRLTDSPDTDNTLNTLSVDSSGLLRAAWGQPDGVTWGHNDVSTLRAQLPGDEPANQPPALTLPAPVTVDATGPDGAAVPFDADATDTDGTATAQCAPASGDTFAIGTTVVTCTATDDDGAVSSGSFPVTVRGARAQLADLLVAVTGVGPGHSLAARIRTAVDRLPDRFLPLACFPLKAFIRSVQAQSGRHIPADQAAAFVEDATRIGAVLGCR